MPSRKDPIISGSFYHVYNKTYQYAPFLDQHVCNRARFALWYLNNFHSISLTNYLKASANIQQKQIEDFQQYGKKVELLAYSFMPNHFHFLVKQIVDGGISRFVTSFENSITQYFNKRNNLRGPVFQLQFQTSIITNQEHLLHVSRYIHLNEYSAKLVHSMEQLMTLPTNSLSIYMNKLENEHYFLDTKTLSGLFGTTENHFNFVNDYKEYQRTISNLRKIYIDS